MLKLRFPLIAFLAAFGISSCSPQPADEPEEPAVKAEFTAVSGLEDRAVDADGESFEISFTY